MQDEVEKALRRLHWQGKHVLSAGRTDAGVHATGQVIAFDLEWKHSDQDLRQAVNAVLPNDVVAREVQPVSSRFDPRRHAILRQYTYRLFCQEIRDPLRERYAWRVWPPVDLTLLHQAAATLVGSFDFRAFGTPPRAGGSTLRTIARSSWCDQNGELIYEVESQAFLYHMVRRMVMVQVAIGQGKASLASLEQALNPSPGETVKGLAPPQGLFLARVLYPPEKLVP